MTHHRLSGRRQAIRTFPSAAIAGIAVGTFLLRADPAFAQLAAGGTLDTSLEGLKWTLDQSGALLAERAQQLLLGLLVFNFVWRGGRWALSSQSFSDFAEAMVYTIGIATLAWGFAAAVPDVVGWLAATASDITNQVTTGAAEAFVPAAVTPSGIVRDGLWRILEWERRIEWNPGTWIYLVCVFVSVFVLAVKLAMVIVVYAELYLVGLIGIFTLGFAGLAQTQGIAARYVMGLFGKGFKLLALLLLVSQTESLADVVATPDLEGALSAVLLQAVGAVMIIMLPGAVERLVAGSAIGDAAAGAATKVGGAGSSGLGAAAGGRAGGAGGAAVGAAKGAWTARKAGGKAMAKAAGIDAAKGAWNWGSAGRQGKITEQLGSRMGRRVNRLGASKPKGGKEGGS